MLESVSAKNMCNEHEDSTQREVPACRSQNRQHAQKGLVTVAVLTFAAVLFKHRNEGQAICTYQAMLGNNKGHSKLTSQHTNPQNTLLHQQQQFLSQSSLECTSCFHT